MERINKAEGYRTFPMWRIHLEDISNGWDSKVKRRLSHL